MIRVSNLSVVCHVQHVPRSVCQEPASADSAEHAKSLSPVVAPVGRGWLFTRPHFVQNRHLHTLRSHATAPAAHAPPTWLSLGSGSGLGLGRSGVGWSGPKCTVEIVHKRRVQGLCCVPILLVDGAPSATRYTAALCTSYQLHSSGNTAAVQQQYAAVVSAYLFHLQGAIDNPVGTHAKRPKKTARKPYRATS